MGDVEISIYGIKKAVFAQVIMNFFIVIGNNFEVEMLHNLTVHLKQ